MVIDVDALANEIRRVDGSHSLGAGALAEALMPFIERALEPQGQALPVVAWLTEWPKDRIRSAGKLVELDEPEQKFSMNHYEPLVRLSDARSYASQLALPAGPVPEDALHEGPEIVTDPAYCARPNIANSKRANGARARRLRTSTYPAPNDDYLPAEEGGKV